MTELHVLPDERTTRWGVYEPPAPAPLSEHTSVTEAEFAARSWADERGAERVIVHDRYHRTYEPTRSLALQRSRTRAVRARELAVVRARIHQLPADPRSR